LDPITPAATDKTPAVNATSGIPVSCMGTVFVDGVTLVVLLVVLLAGVTPAINTL
jgi:hypothetical protein